MENWRIDTKLFVGGGGRAMPEGEPNLTDLLRYWRTMAREVETSGASGIPDRRAIDPIAVPRLLANLFIVAAPGRDHERVRLAGTALVDHLGCDPTGQPVAGLDVAQGFDAVCRPVTRAVAAQTAPVHAGGVHAGPTGAPFRWEMVMCPLRDGGPGIDAAIGCFVTRSASAGPASVKAGCEFVEPADRLLAAA